MGCLIWSGGHQTERMGTFGLGGKLLVPVASLFRLREGLGGTWGTGTGPPCSAASCRPQHTMRKDGHGCMIAMSKDGHACMIVIRNDGHGCMIAMSKDGHACMIAMRRTGHAR
jgi:hypothetical protein